MCRKENSPRAPLVGMSSDTTTLKIQFLKKLQIEILDVSCKVAKGRDLGLIPWGS